MSPAGNAGFTLLELLVVLVIIGLTAALIPGFTLRDRSGLDLARAAQDIADGLRRTRSDAMLTNSERRFLLDVEARQFRASNARAPRQIGPAIALAFRTARSEQFAETGGAIRFFPDGSATGGVIALSEGRERRLIEVDWLTGMIEETDGGR
ncbi:MAG: prepilin-type N-terminal cleavage/methylation domain-containing protein [Alphaproteobacteria bacterium]|nr:prepilin-type N-terminal cleavage/methylation domain-containing protein [Alphaproteobacteria bacterium]